MKRVILIRAGADIPEGATCIMRGTEDKDLRAIKSIYWLLNLWPLPCRKDYLCEWVYPYGFVPEAGCPWHD